MLGFNLNNLLHWQIWWGSLGGNLLLMLCLYLSIYRSISIYLSIYLYIYRSISIYPSIYLSISLHNLLIDVFSIHQAIHLPTHLSIYIYLSIYLYILYIDLYQSIYISFYLHLFIYLYIYIYLSIYLYLSIHLFIYLSIYLHIYFYIVLLIIWDTDWLNTVTWSTNIYVALPILIYHTFWQTELAILSLQTCMLTVLWLIYNGYLHCGAQYWIALHCAQLPADTEFCKFLRAMPKPGKAISI